MRFGKRQKWLIVIATILILLIISVQIWVNALVVPVVEDRISDLVKKESRGLYQLAPFSLSWNVANQSFIFSDIHLHYDSLALDKISREGLQPLNVFQLIIPFAQLSIWDVWDAFTDKNLKARNVEIDRPRLMVQHLRERTAKDSLPDQREIIGAINQIFNSLEISELKLSEGDFQYRHSGTQGFSAKNINISVSELKLDSMLHEDLSQWISVEEVEMEMDLNDYSFVLPDSSYVIQTQRVGISSERSEIFIDDLRLHPNYRFYQQKQEQGIAQPNLFELSIPRIQLGGMGIQKAWLEDKLEIGSVRFINPQIYQLSPVEEDSLKKNRHLLSPKALYDRISPFFSSIKIDGVSIERASYERLSQLGDTTRMASVRGVGLYLQNLQLDSLIIKENPRLFLSDEIELKVDTFQAWLSHNNYALTGGRTEISTFQRRLLSSDIRISPVEKKWEQARRTGADVMELFVPSIEIEGMDLPAVWFDEILDVSEILIDYPAFSLTNNPRIQKQKVDSLAQADLYLLIDDYLKSLTVRNLKITNGQFSFNPDNDLNPLGYQASDLNIRIDNFKINPQARSQQNNPFYADDIDIELNIQDYSWMLPDSSHAIAINQINISTADSAIFLDSVRLIPQSNNWKRKPEEHRIGLLVPGIRLTGLDAYQAYFNKTLHADSLIIYQPDLSVESRALEKQSESPFSSDQLDLYPLIENQLSAISIRHIGLRNARVEQKMVLKDTVSSLILPQLSMAITEFFIDDSTQMGPSNMLYARDIKLVAADIKHALKDSVHNLSLGRLYLSTSSGEVQMNQIKLFPNDSLEDHTEKPPNLYWMEVPVLNLKGLNLYKLYHEKICAVDRLFIQKPKLVMENYPDIEKAEIDSIAQADLYLPISDQLARRLTGQKNFRSKMAFSALIRATNSRPELLVRADIQLIIGGISARFYGSEPKVIILFTPRVWKLLSRSKTISFYLPDSTYEVKGREYWIRNS